MAEGEGLESGTVAGELELTCRHQSTISVKAVPMKDLMPTIHFEVLDNSSSSRVR